MATEAKRRREDETSLILPGSDKYIKQKKQEKVQIKTHNENNEHSNVKLPLTAEDMSNIVLLIVLYMQSIQSQFPLTQSSSC